MSSFYIHGGSLVLAFRLVPVPSTLGFEPSKLYLLHLVLLVDRWCLWYQHQASIIPFQFQIFRKASFFLMALSKLFDIFLLSNQKEVVLKDLIDFVWEVDILLKYLLIDSYLNFVCFEFSFLVFVSHSCSNRAMISCRIHNSSRSWSSKQDRT